ncbi:hypothetical protein ABENE_07205 [Asticcacaulis benevestitus DSM 16100 = ATCC BAA-896]|uniref:Uncharacterized protein n=1 Tax=Asticcacaulis benevestitus DSM 16100 = ATCC BAA-896 TaxID=1121022 RepID=V4PZM1_9CAUL|nr:hypothetical protein ABENE_07205 [Asticcacaulis benevestitus DSM 16100 = ATCC BAA-896]
MSDTIAVFFFLKRHSDIGIGRQPHLIAFYIGDKPEVDKVVMALVRVAFHLKFFKLDAMAFNAVHRANMNAIGADNVRMFLNICCIYHGHLLKL